MYQTAEHAVESSLRLLALPIAPTSATAVVIDALRRHFDDTYLEHGSSGFTKHDWHANAVMVIKQSERALGAGSLEWDAIVSRYGDNSTGGWHLAVNRLALHVGAGLDHRVTMRLIQNVQQGRPSLREIEAEYVVSYSTLQRRSRVVSGELRRLERAGFDVLDTALRAAGSLS